MYLHLCNLFKLYPEFLSFFINQMFIFLNYIWQLSPSLSKLWTWGQFQDNYRTSPSKPTRVVHFFKSSLLSLSFCVHAILKCYNNIPEKPDLTLKVWVRGWTMEISTGPFQPKYLFYYSMDSQRKGPLTEQNICLKHKTSFGQVK